VRGEARHRVAQLRGQRRQKFLGLAYALPWA
jgi:hypothetical protein